MEVQAFTTLPSAQSCVFKPFSFPSHQRQLFLRRTSPLSQKCPPANIKVLAIISKQDLASESFGSLTSEPSESWESWLWSDGSNSGRNPSATKSPKMGLFESIPTKTRWAALLLYRALLVGGIGLSMGAPAVAGPAPSLASEVVVQKAVEKVTQKTEEKGAQKGAQNEAADVLGDVFWKDMDLSKGSIELVLKKILEDDPTNVPALECLAKKLVENDDFAHALLVFEKLEVLDSDEIEWKYMKAQVYDMDGQFQLAKKGFEDILKVEPFSSRALQGLVIAMDQLDETDAALKIVEDTMAKAKQENNLVEARNMGILIGQFHTLKGHLQQALHHYKEMMDEDAADFRPYLCQGIIYSVLGDKTMAEQQFKTYDKLCPKDFPDRKFLDGLTSRAKREGQKVYDLKQKQKSQGTTKGEEKQSSDQSSDK